MRRNIHEIRRAWSGNAAVLEGNRITECQAAVNRGVGGQTQCSRVSCAQDNAAVPNRIARREAGGSRYSVAIARINECVSDHCIPPRAVRHAYLLGQTLAEASVAECDVDVHGNICGENAFIDADEAIETSLRGNWHAGVIRDVDFETAS